MVETSREGESADVAALVGASNRFSIGGYLKNETAFRFKEPRSITKIRDIAYLNGSYSFSSDYRLVFAGWAYHDSAYDLFDYQTISGRFARDSDKPLVFIDNLQQQKDSDVAEIRELYLDSYFDKLDLRIGKQYVVWGVLEGIRITDEVNPIDFRELILPDLLDYRISQWTLRADYYAENNASYELIWIPDIQFHKAAPPGSEWELLQDIRDANGNLLTKVPPQTLANSEIGVKMSTEIGGADVTFSYLYTWDYFPVLFRTLLVNSALPPVFIPTYTRINMYGATLVKQLGKGVLKAETAFVPDKYFGIRNDTDRNGDGYLDDQGEMKKQHIRWGLGYDISLWGVDWSPAITQWIVLGYDPALIQPQYDTSISLFARKPLPEYAAVFQVLAIGLINMKELYLKPKYIFNVTDRFQIAAGLDLFFGSKSQLGISGGSTALTGTNAINQDPHFFGNFTGNDRIFAEFKYTF